jgi:hypothetical protein
MNVLSDYSSIFFASCGFLAGFIAGVRFYGWRMRATAKSFAIVAAQIEQDRIARQKEIGKKLEAAKQSNDLDAVASLATELLSNYPMQKN